MRIVVVISLLLLLTAGLPGCNTARIQRENNRLRERVMDLEDETQLLRKRNAELEIELAGESSSADSASQDIRAATPHLADLGIGRLSHARDTDDDGRPDTLVLYVAPEDGRGRFIQLAGRITAHAAVLPAEGQAVTIGQRSWSPEEVRDAYRSSFMGTHYTLELPIEEPKEVESEATAITVTYIDGRTGRSLEAHRSVKLRAQ